MRHKIHTILATVILSVSTGQLFAQTLYTMTTQGGHFSGTCNNDVPGCGLGMILSYDLSTDSLTPRFYFTDSSGYIPDGYMIQASDGNLYGLTTAGGLNGLSPGDVIPSGGSGAGGTLFQYNYNTGVYTVVQNLDAYAIPGGAPVQAGDGNIYGLTLGTGVNGSGSIFQYNYNTNTFTNVYDLPDSSWPGGCSLMQASDGNLYGMTTNNGTYNSGTLFQYNYSTNTYTVVKNLDPGAYPYGSTLVEAPDSNLYGMTSSNGSINSGTIFQYNYRTKTYTTKKSFDRYANPYGCVLALANDSNLYGMTYGDGLHNGGAIFQYNYRTNFYTLKYSLPASASPWGSLTQASDGNLYGFTQLDGTNHDGTMFQYNYTTNTYKVLVNFNGKNGAYPIHNRFVEVQNTTGISNPVASTGIINISPNPSSGRFNINLPQAAGTGTIEVYNILGEKVYTAPSQALRTSNPIDLSTQAAGVYFVRVNAGNSEWSVKVVKE